MTNPGGRTWQEEQAWESRERLERDHEHHNVIQLPCCGTSVEYDPTEDQYITCPNTKCMKHHVILRGLNPQVRSEIEEPNDGRIHLIH